MKKKEKLRRPERVEFDAVVSKKPKLKPIEKEKYKVRDKYQDDEDDEELDLFNFEND